MAHIIIIIPFITTITDDYDYVLIQQQYPHFKIVKSHNRYYYQNKNAKYWGKIEFSYKKSILSNTYLFPCTSCKFHNCMTVFQI